MKKTLLSIVSALLVLSLITGCRTENTNNDENGYGAIMKSVCEVNNIPYLNEAGDSDEEVYEIILCGVVNAGSAVGNIGGIVLVPDNDYFSGYEWPWNGVAAVRFNSTIIFDELGSMYDYSYETDLIGKHIILICKNIIASSHPAKLVGQRVTVILND